MIDKTKVIEIVKELESRTYRIGSSDSLISDEEKYNLLKLFIDDKITEAEFISRAGNELGCPPEPSDEYCADVDYDVISALNYSCEECWEKYLTSNIK